MRYILLIYSNENEDAAATPEVGRGIMERYFALTKDLRESGAFQAGDGLQPTTAATTVRVRNGQTLTTDGPFAETKEQLGGFYLVEAADLDEAVAWAARIPTAERGSIEVRPIMDYSAA
jgi:hypothetical protein